MQPQKEGDDLTREMTNASARMRIMEERTVNLRRKLQVTEQNMVAMHRTQAEDLRAIKEDIQAIKNELLDAKNAIKVVVAQLDSFAKREDLLTVQKYLSYWEPVRFVTEERAEKIARGVMDEKKV